MDAVLINGTQLLLDCIYDNIGFNCIPDEILRHLVIARVSQPARRIEAHMFAFALSPIKIYKELERIIKEKNIDLSVGKVLDAVKTITTIRVKMPENEEIYTKTLFLTDKHRAIRSLFDFADEPK